MTFYLLRAYHRRTNAVNVPNNEIQMGVARGRRCRGRTGNFLAIYGTLKRNGRPPSLKSVLSHIYISRPESASSRYVCFHGRPDHQYKFCNPLYALIMSIIKTPGASARALTHCGPLKRYCDLNLGLDLWRGD